MTPAQITYLRSAAEQRFAIFQYPLVGRTPAQHKTLRALDRHRGYGTTNTSDAEFNEAFAWVHDDYRYAAARGEPIDFPEPE